MCRVLKVGIVLFLISILLSCSAASKFTVDQKSEFEQVMAQLNTPEKVNDWLVKNFYFDYELQKSLSGVKRTEREFWRDCIQLPIETYYSRRGVCYDAANFAACALSKAGYKVVTLMVKTHKPSQYGSTGHTVCAFYRDEKWWVCADTRLSGVIDKIAGPFNDLEEAAVYACGYSGGRDNYKGYDISQRRKGW